MVIPSWLNRTNIYYFGLALMLIALPLSKYLMSVSQLLLVANWLFDPAILKKWKSFFKNRAAMIVASVFVLYVIGLAWTSDFDYAAKDIRIKLPLLVLPLIISTSPKIGRSLFHYFMILFIAANVVGSFFSIHELLTKEITEIRKISLFMSHIRFSLNICVAIFVGIYFVFSSTFFNRIVKAFLILTVIWLLIFLVILESVTGLVIMLVVSMLLVAIIIFKSRSLVLKFSLIVVLILVPLLLTLHLRTLYLEYVPDKPFTYEGMEKVSSHGNPYYHDPELKGAENGNWVGQYIQMDELKQSWLDRSAIHFDSLDNAGHWVRYTLIRYLTSKGLRKDADGVAALSDDEIRHIENGVASVNQLTETSLENRLRTIIWEIMLFEKSGYLSGHSVAQRIEFWKASKRIIQKNFWFGTGTGDISNAFRDEYVEMNSQLDPQFRWRSHNQYMSVLATLGIFGLLWFLFALIYPARHLRMFSDYFYLVFFCILIISMLTEDTIENQAGATFFAFFNSFFLLSGKDKNLLSSNQKTTNIG